MTADLDTSIRASRVRVPRSRGAASGVLLVVLGAWAALVPFIGPYLNLAFTPKPNSAWHWTPDRGWLHVLPGALTVLGGLLLLLSGSRVVTSFGAWLAALSGAWLIVSPALSDVVKLSTGRPDPTSGKDVRALTSLVFFFGIGALILFVAALALGRLSVHSVRDVRAAERRAAAEEAAAAEEERRLAREREAYAQEREQSRTGNGGDIADGADGADRPTDGEVAGADAVGSHGSQDGAHDGRTAEYQGQPGQSGPYQGQPGQPGPYQGQPGQPGPYQGQPGQSGPYQGQPGQPGQIPGQQQPYTSAPPPPEQRN